jgi:hypothetical protein
MSEAYFKGTEALLRALSSESLTVVYVEIGDRT